MSGELICAICGKEIKGLITNISCNEDGGFVHESCLEQQDKLAEQHQEDMDLMGY